MMKEVQVQIVAKEMKLTPIHPLDFRDMTKQRVLALQPKFKFGANMLQGFEYYGATYNEVIHMNRNGSEPTRFALPAPTGSAKSVSSRLYLSMLPQLSSSGLLVVGKVKTAIEAVKEMNTLAGGKVAACMYHPSKENPDCDERVALEMLHKYPIAVITHNMFLSRSSSMCNIDIIRNHKDKPRECVIIDERIDFKRTISFSSEEIDSAISLVKDIKGWEAIDDIFIFLYQRKNTSLIEKGTPPQIAELMLDGIRILQSGNGYVGKAKDKRDQSREIRDRQWLIELMDRIYYVFSNQNMIMAKGKETIYSVNEDLTNKFGSLVILDATANSTPIYMAHDKNRDDMQNFGMPKGIRNYKNSTLHVLRNKNMSQSKNKLVDIAKQLGHLDDIVSHYLSLLYPLVSDGSKLLVCTFLGIEEVFRTTCKDENITFIHWGEHDGRNDFSHYPKVAGIGWFRKSKNKYYEDIDAILINTEEYCPVTDCMGSDVISMIAGGLAADFIQLFNRSRSRVAIDEEGNCCQRRS